MRNTFFWVGCFPVLTLCLNGYSKEVCVCVVGGESRGEWEAGNGGGILLQAGGRVEKECGREKGVAWQQRVMVVGGVATRDQKDKSAHGIV